MTWANDFSTTTRRTLSVGVSSPSATVRSRGRMAKARTDSARDTDKLASSIAAWTADRSRGSSTDPATVAFVRPRVATHSAKDS